MVLADLLPHLSSAPHTFSARLSQAIDQQCGAAPGIARMLVLERQTTREAIPAALLLAEIAWAESEFQVASRYSRAALGLTGSGRGRLWRSAALAYDALSFHHLGQAENARIRLTQTLRAARCPAERYLAHLAGASCLSWTEPLSALRHVDQALTVGQMLPSVLRSHALLLTARQTATEQLGKPAVPAPVRRPARVEVLGRRQLHLDGEVNALGDSARAALLLTYLTVEGETTVASAATALLAEGCTRTEERRRHASIRELARWTGEYVHHPALVTVHAGQLRLSGAFEWSSDLADALTQGRLTAADLPRVDCVWIHDLSERSLGEL